MRNTILVATCVVVLQGCSRGRDKTHCDLVEKGFARAEELTAGAALRGERMRELSSLVITLDNDIHYCLHPDETKPKRDDFKRFDAAGEYERLKVVWARAN